MSDDPVSLYVVLCSQHTNNIPARLQSALGFCRVLCFSCLVIKHWECDESQNLKWFRLICLINCILYDSSLRVKWHRRKLFPINSTPYRIPCIVMMHSLELPCTWYYDDKKSSIRLCAHIFLFCWIGILLLLVAHFCLDSLLSI